jgi:S1-C subfamily serine protease
VTADPAPDHHVRVSKIIPDSPAARSGLAVGDVLLALNGSPIESVGTFLAGVKSFKPETTSSVVYDAVRRRWISR